MDLNLELKKELVQKLASHLSVELWWTDHGDLMNKVVKDIYPDNNFDTGLHDPASKAGKKARNDLASWHKKFWKEMTTDTVAVGITRGGNELVIAANIKQRTEQAIRRAGRGGGKDTASDPAYFGFYDRRHEDAIQRLCGVFPQTESSRITVLVPETFPKSKQENGRMHAEMQIVRYAAQDRLDIELVGISKPACRWCAEQLGMRSILHVHSDEEGQLAVPDLEPAAGQQGNRRVTNWDDPLGETVGGVRPHTRFQQSRRIQFRLLRLGENGVQRVEYKVGSERVDLRVVDDDEDKAGKSGTRGKAVL